MQYSSEIWNDNKRTSDTLHYMVHHTYKSRIQLQAVDGTMFNISQTAKQLFDVNSTEQHSKQT